MSKKSFRVSGPVRVGWICEVVGDWVSGLSRFDVGVKLLDVHDGDGSEDGNIEGGCSKGQCQLFVSKNWMEIVSIYRSIVAASFLRVYIPLSSQSVGLDLSWPGWKRMTRLNCDKYSDQWTCHLVRSLVLMKYLRFLWLVTTLIGEAVPPK